MKTAKPAKVLLAVAAILGAGALLWPRTTEFRAHLLEAYAQSPDAAKPDAAKSEAAKSEAPAAQGRGGAGGQGRPAVNVRTAPVERGALPFINEAVGTVQPIAAVAIRSRIDAQIETVLVSDGAPVKAGDTLVKLDSRQIEAQIKQAEAQLAKDRTLLEQAERDVARYSELLSKQTGTQVNLDNARTSAAGARAAILGDQAQIENLNVQLSWYTIKAPISGRVSTFSQKAGNIVRSGDSTATGTLTTIVQTTPIYVSFSVPQRLLSDLREAMNRPDSEVTVTPQGGTRSVKGRIAVLDNAIDPATGTIMVRAVFENADEALWSGQLCQVRITLRVDPDVVSLPREAVQTGQSGNYVYVIEDNVAKVRTVELGRTQEGRDIVMSGLKGGETVVTDGALALTNGARVETRSAEAKKGNS
jgi:multidrug efflux system membrane fusion protein